MRIDKSLALYRKETANSVKLAVSHIGLCPSHEDFERIALKILRRYWKDTGGATGDSYQSALYQQLLSIGAKTFC
ncbi:MAG: hypothetical protein FRX49_01738 [Trebouxia sp. A1-2]|nr:MAG: hypothetical protein FRX49_01738 [Trebouxia sp. A1-2]